MSLRYQLDEDLSYAVAQGLRRHDVDAASVHELGRTGLPNELQLRLAADMGRVLVTYNRAEYQILDAEWRLRGQNHAGILWCTERTLPRRDVGALVAALQAMAAEYEMQICPFQ